MFFASEIGLSFTEESASPINIVSESLYGYVSHDTPGSRKRPQG